MQYHQKFLYRAVSVLLVLFVFPLPGQDIFPTVRDSTKWPFAQNSIWNMPIGSNARYVFANISPAGFFDSDENVLILRPKAPVVPIYYGTCGWGGCDRCASATSTIRDNVPIPPEFSTHPGFLGEAPNMAAAILMPDGRTIRQNQPFSRCGPNGKAVSRHFYATVDIRGDGIEGAHGGSHMSSIGGTIRLGELLPGGVIRHAMQVCMWSQKNYSRGYIWPALHADGGQGGSVPEMKYGALVCLKPDFPLDALLTEPAKIIARAFINYGAYPVDDTAWDAFYINTEWSPDGRVIDEFKQTYGYDYRGPLSTSAGARANWCKDINTIVKNLYVVANNSRTTIGGGGTPRQPLAPPFGVTGVEKARTCGAPAAGIKVVYKKDAGIMITLPASAHYSAQVLNINGAVVVSAAGSGKTIMVPVSSLRLAAGIYIVKVQSDNGRPFIAACNIIS